MTAKSRRRKLDKRKKTDEHPRPRRTEAADGRTKGSGSRASFSAAEGLTDEAATEDRVAVIEAATLKEVFLVPEGQGFPGSFITPEDIDELLALHEVDPREIGIDPPQKGGKLYLNDREFEAFVEVREEYQRRVAKGVRTTGSSDTASA